MNRRKVMCVVSHSPASPARALTPVHARASWRNSVRARQVLATLRTNLHRQNGRGGRIKTVLLMNRRKVICVGVAFPGIPRKGTQPGTRPCFVA